MMTLLQDTTLHLQLRMPIVWICTQRMEGYRGKQHFIAKTSFVCEGCVDSSWVVGSDDGMSQNNSCLLNSDADSVDDIWEKSPLFHL